VGSGEKLPGIGEAVDEVGGQYQIVAAELLIKLEGISAPRITSKPDMW
jgi:hypothetical protein